MTDHDPDGFRIFWQVYPRKVARLDALKAWNTLRPSVDLQVRILNALQWQRHQPQWTCEGGCFIPYPASWLRAGQWDDEPVQVPVSPLEQRRVAQQERAIRQQQEWRNLTPEQKQAVLRGDA